MAGSKRVTIAQIAREAQAAQSTVSCVLNGKFKESGASTERIAQIQAIASKLNYRPRAVRLSVQSRSSLANRLPAWANATADFPRENSDCRSPQGQSAAAGG